MRFVLGARAAAPTGIDSRVSGLPATAQETGHGGPLILNCLPRSDARHEKAVGVDEPRVESVAVSCQLGDPNGHFTVGISCWPEQPGSVIT
jgi:hypothetical protein